MDVITYPYWDLSRTNSLKRSQVFVKCSYFRRASGAFALDVIARTGFGVVVNSQKDKDDEFLVNAKKAMNFGMSNPLFIVSGKFIKYYLYDILVSATVQYMVCANDSIWYDTNDVIAVAIYTTEFVPKMKSTPFVIFRAIYGVWMLSPDTR